MILDVFLCLFCGAAICYGALWVHSNINSLCNRVSILETPKQSVDAQGTEIEDEGEDVRGSIGFGGGE